MDDVLNISVDAQRAISADQAWHYRIVPSTLEDGRLTILMEEERISEALRTELQVLLGKEIELQATDTNIVSKALGKYYRKVDTKDRTLFTSGSTDQLTMLLGEAKQIGSSDIHFEALEKRGRVRMRIDGQLIERYTIGKEQYPAMINKIKVAAKLDIAEKRRPQDGRIQFEKAGMKFDIRVSMIPTLHGEKAVLRLLGQESIAIDLMKLGMSEIQLNSHMAAIRRPNGLVLISGPTGSGKTTTLYASLKQINDEKRNIVTIEDPIEYTLDGINQMQLRENIDVGFAEALRSFLRQDPDIIMVGEIRDKATADMAIRAALTGHLVLSTIHTNDAWGTVSRLIDMGVPPFLLSSTLNITIAQRLLRLLCDRCKQAVRIEKDRLPSKLVVKDTLEAYGPEGCEKCYYTGYSGRVAVYEHIPIDREWAALIRNGEVEISAMMKKQNIATLSDQAYGLLKSGKSSLEEVFPLLEHNS